MVSLGQILDFLQGNVKLYCRLFEKVSRNGHISSGVPRLPKGCCRTALILPAPSGLHHFFSLPGWSRPRVKRASSLLLGNQRAAPNSTCWESLFVCLFFQPLFKDAKTPKSEELEELPQLKGRMAAEAGERKLMEIRGEQWERLLYHPCPSPEPLRSSWCDHGGYDFTLLTG